MDDFVDLDNENGSEGSSDAAGDGASYFFPTNVDAASSSTTHVVYYHYEEDDEDEMLAFEDEGEEAESENSEGDEISAACAPSLGCVRRKRQHSDSESYSENDEEEDDSDDSDRAESVDFRHAKRPRVAEDDDEDQQVGAGLDDDIDEEEDESLDNAEEANYLAARQQSSVPSTPAVAQPSASHPAFLTPTRQSALIEYLALRIKYFDSLREYFDARTKQFEEREEQWKSKEDQLLLRIYQLQDRLSGAETSSRRESLNNSLRLERDVQSTLAVKEQLEAANMRIEYLQHYLADDSNSAPQLRASLEAKSQELLNIHRTLTDLKNDISRLNAENETLRSRLHAEEARAQRLDEQIYDKESFVLLNKQLNEYLQQLQVVDKQNKLLLREKDEYFKKLENIELLKEQVLNLQQQNSRIAQLEEELNTLRAEKDRFSNDWNAMFQSQSISDVFAFFKKVKYENLVLQGDSSAHKVELGYLQSRVTTLERSEESLRKELIASREENKYLYQYLADSASDIKVLYARVDRETAMLDTYAREDASVAGAQYDRVSELEQLVAERDKQIAQIREESHKKQKDSSDEIKQLRRTDVESQSRIAALEQEKAVLANEKQSLTRQRDRLEQQIAEYEARIGRGLDDYNRSTTMILHMKVNPEVMAQAGRQTQTDTVETLRAKLYLAQDKLEKLERAGKEESNININELKAELDDKEKRIVRLKEAFHKQIADFRTLVYLLFGWRIDLANNNEYRLSSIYAEEEHDHLMFRFERSPAGSKLPPRVEMLETDMVRKIKPDTKEHLQEFGSFPAFLSLVLLDLFNSYTLFKGALAPT